MDVKHTSTAQPVTMDDSSSKSAKLYSIFEYPDPEYSSTASATGKANALGVSLSCPLDDSPMCHRSKMSEDHTGNFFPELFHVPLYEEPPPGYNSVTNKRPCPELESDKQGMMVPSQQLIRQQNQQLHRPTSVLVSANTPLRQTSVIVQQTAAVTVSYRSHITLACFTFWLCGVVFGSLAFFLAVAAEKRKKKGDRVARQLGCASLVLSIIGIVIGNGVAIAIGISIGVATNSSSYVASNHTISSPLS